jgi:hypothetical protein
MRWEYPDLYNLPRHGLRRAVASLGSREEAETFIGRLEEVWSTVASDVVSQTGYRITELTEERYYGSEAGHRAT